MLSPEELIGQKVWLTVQPDLEDSQTHRIKAEITQPTSPPWFFARYLNPPTRIQVPGQWMSLYEAQQAALIDPVIELEEEHYEDLYEDELDLI